MYFRESFYIYIKGFKESKKKGEKKIQKKYKRKKGNFVKNTLWINGVPRIDRSSRILSNSNLIRNQRYIFFLKSF